MNDRTPLSDDWSDLTAAWTAPGPTTDDLTALARRIRRRDALARVNFWMEAGGCVLTAGLVVGIALARALPPMIVAAALVFSVFALALTLWARRGLGEPQTGTAEAAVETALRQARAGLRWAWSGLAIAAAALVFVALILIESGPIRTTLWGALAGGAFLIGALGMYANHARLCRRRIAAHEAALAALGEEA